MSEHRSFEGEITAAGLKLGVVVSRFNSFITDRLLGGALDAISRTGGDLASVDVAKVPGSLEIAVVAREMAAGGSYDAIICLGAVIRGETPHFDYIAAETARGVAAVGRETGTPVVFGVLTCNNLEQAIDRAGAKGGNAGFQAALSAIETANLLKKLRGASN